MKYYETVLDLVGKTPLVKLNRLADSSMANVFAKLEQLNPGGSVKDRMAVNMVRRAEAAGLIKTRWHLGGEYLWQYGSWFGNDRGRQRLSVHLHDAGQN